MSGEDGARLPGDSATLHVAAAPRGESLSERLQNFEPVAPEDATPAGATLGPLAPGDVLGHYRILGRLGSGGMGYIHRALDLRLEREVALKVALESVAQDHEAMLREARALAALNHPNVVTVHEVGLHEGSAYIVMELLRGETLRARMDRALPSLVGALSFACDVLRGLSAAHNASIVHLDVKPENVFLTKDGSLKLIDFGIARHKRTGAHEQAEIVGTIAYMAPEQLLGDPLDFRADIFAFGILLHELVTGRHPFMRANIGATMNALLQGDFFPDGQAFDPEVEAIVRACMAIEPSSRQPSAAHVLEDLERVLRARTQAPLVIVPVPRPGQAEPGPQTPINASTPKAPEANPHRVVPFLAMGLVAAASVSYFALDRKDEKLRHAATSAIVAARPVRNRYTLELESTPVGAAVKEGDKQLGKTPMAITLDRQTTETRVFTLSLEGYADYTFRQEPATEDVRFVALLAKAEPAPTVSATATSEPATATGKRVSGSPPPRTQAAKTSAPTTPEPPRPTGTVDIRLNR